MNYLVDGMNEKGLAVNGFYHPGYADYPELNPETQSTSIEVLDLCQFFFDDLQQYC